jgi:hypothetical protein
VYLCCGVPVVYCGVCLSCACGVVYVPVVVYCGVPVCCRLSLCHVHARCTSGDLEMCVSVLAVLCLCVLSTVPHVHASRGLCAARCARKRHTHDTHECRRCCMSVPHRSMF